LPCSIRETLFLPHAIRKKEEYAKEVIKANFKRLAHLIKVCEFLMQIKVYLFWGRFVTDLTEIQ